MKSTYLTVIALPLLAACGAGSAATGVGTVGATVAAPASSVATSTAAASTASTAATANAAATTATTSTAAARTVGKGQSRLSIAVWDDTVRTWQDIYAQTYAEQHPEITLEIDKIASGNMAIEAVDRAGRRHVAGYLLRRRQVAELHGLPRRLPSAR
ncbi:MAG: hypothetical protein ACR2JY_13295 [Chloroflexota bacterium]